MRAARFLLLAGCFLALAAGVRAQATDDFSGGFNPALPWRWDVPGNTPQDTRDPATYRFSPTTLELGFSAGGLWGSGGSARNLPNLLVFGQPESWFLETAVAVDWSQVGPAGFVQANLALFDDAENFFFLHLVQNPPAGTLSVSTNLQNEARGVASGFGGVAGGGPSRDFAGLVRLRIEGTPSQITLLSDTGAGFLSVGTLSAASTGQALSSWEYLSEGLVGKRVGLLAHLGGGAPTTTPARYDYFTTDLNVIPEPGTLTLLACGLLPAAGAVVRRRTR